jgi:TRAP transporter TAXI family solute receptor
VTNPSPGRGVGSRMPLPALLAAAVALVVVLGGLALWWSLARARPSGPLVLATGPEAGAYHALGTALARLIEEEGLAPQVTVRPTQGSGENMELLSTGVADLAIIQSDTDADEQVRLITSLYEESMHVLVSATVAGPTSQLSDLHGRRVSLGGAHSGTRQVAERILAHFEVVPDQDLALAPEDAVAALEAGDLDAVFALTAVPSRVVAELASRERVRFLSLGDAQMVGNEADALALVYPKLHATIVPRGTYGPVPREPVRTVGVEAQLVVRDDVDQALVLDMTRAIFAGRNRLNDTDHDLSFGDRLTESYTPGTGGLPYHPGAIAYYERFHPSFVVEYAEPMSLALTLLVGAWSATLALRGWFARGRKNRIDAYYLEVVRDAPDLSRATAEELLARRDNLVKVRERAFTDLVNERLEANESFSIFQSHVDGELASIQRRLAGMRGSS